MDIGRPGHLENYYRKVIRKDHNEISLDADMIRLLIAIDENKSLYQIADEVEMEDAILNKNLSKLLEQRLIEPVKKDLPAKYRFLLCHFPAPTNIKCAAPINVGQERGRKDTHSGQKSPSANFDWRIPLND